MSRTRAAYALALGLGGAVGLLWAPGATPGAAQQQCCRQCAPGTPRNAVGCCLPVRERCGGRAAPSGSSGSSGGRGRCREGQSRTRDTEGHCCWAGQSWNSRREACVGVPTDCPDGTRVRREACVRDSRGSEGSSPRGRPSSCPPGMLAIPGGSFEMGSPDDAGHEDERPQHEVTLDAFCIDRTEVTVAAYGDCVEANVCAEPNAPSEAYNWTDRARRANHPINGVSWEDARTYCAYRGYRLPTEAEWEYAARGTDARIYPWGEAAPAAVHLQSSIPCGEWDCTAETARVGTHPAGASPFGVQDMAGNVAEWVRDWYGAYPSGEVRNPQGPEGGRHRVNRGGGRAIELPDQVRAAARGRLSPTHRFSYLGFRCVQGGGG
ncbi:MAG: formylglycine-generating enzyme family protein [Sandaracinaceae bacterium]